MPQSPKDVGDAIVLGYLLKKPTKTVLNQPKEKKYVVVNKAEKSWRSEERFGIRHEEAEFGVCPACFQSSFAPHFCTMFSLYPLGMVMYITCNCFLGVFDLLLSSL